MVSIADLANELRRPHATIYTWARELPGFYHESMSVSDELATQLRERSKTSRRCKHANGYYYKDTEKSPDPVEVKDVLVSDVVLSERAGRLAAMLRMSPKEFVDHCVNQRIEELRKELFGG